MNLNEKKIDLVSKHMELVAPIESEINSRITPFLCFIDKSFLLGNYSSITQDELIDWHRLTARLNQKFKKRNSKLVKRLIPILKKDYSELEINFIKHSLSIQLAMGVQVSVVFTSNLNFLEYHFGAGDLVLIKGRNTISCPNFWEDDEATGLIVKDRSSSDIHDKYYEFNSIIESSESHNIKYDQKTFTCFNQSLKEKYGHFLFELQNGSCALTGEKLSNMDWDVDHIFPRSMGGNNSLVNLQAIGRKVNIKKAANIDSFRYCFSPEELTLHELRADYHRKFSDRKLVNIPLGVKALNYSDPNQL